MNSKLVMCDALRSVFAHGRARAYTPYGAIMRVDDQLLAFAGQLRERRTGFYMLGNGCRAYDPVLMRFLGPDRQSPFGRGGISTYAYCLNDPVNRLDPDGEASFKRVAKMVLLSGSTLRNILTRKGGPKAIKDAAKWGGVAGELLQKGGLSVGRAVSEVSFYVGVAAGGYDLGSFFYKRYGEDLIDFEPEVQFSPTTGQLLGVPTVEKPSELPVVKRDGIRREMLFD